MTTRQLSGTVRVQGTDDEWWPFSDEHVDRTFNVNKLLEEGQNVTIWNDLEVKWGGECRVEVDLAAQRQGDQVTCTGQVRFYEGVTENTNDLEDVENFNFLLLKGDNPLHSVSLYNNELFGGDSANVTFNIDNWFYESPDIL